MSPNFRGKTRRRGESTSGGEQFSRGSLYTVLKNPAYIGKVAHHGELHDARNEAIVENTLWQQVQDPLARNRHSKVLRTATKDPSLLAGLLHDDQNNPMSPARTRKADRRYRYRYHVSQAALQCRDRDAGAVTRVPAPAICRWP